MYDLTLIQLMNRASTRPGVTPRTATHPSNIRKESQDLKSRTLAIPYLCLRDVFDVAASEDPKVLACTLAADFAGKVLDSDFPTPRKE